MNWRNPSSIVVSRMNVVEGYMARNSERRNPHTSPHALRLGNLTRQYYHCEERSDESLRYLVHHHLISDAAQRRLLLDRLDRLPRQNGGDFGSLDHRRSDVDFLRGRQALHPRGDVHGLAEIILPLVEHDGETRALMDADLDHEVVAAALGVELLHRRAHLQARGERVFGPDEGRHDRVADRL